MLQVGMSKRRIKFLVRWLGIEVDTTTKAYSAWLLLNLSRHLTIEEQNG